MIPKNKLAVTLPSDTEILMTRRFNAPKELVYKCFADADLVKRWIGCTMGEVKVSEADLRIGGTWRWILEMGEHGSHEMFGQILEIQAPDRMVRTFVYNVPMIRECPSIETATFEEVDGGTNVSILVKHFSKENRDGHVNSGMEQGAGASYDGLEALLEELKG